MVEMMLTEDAQAATARRGLFERLVAITSARELTEYALI
jgi:hypothetical protein